MTTTTIIAKIPARTIRGFANGKTRTIPAMVRQFERDERGCWEAIDGAVRFGCLESDVIDTCSKATNWADIRREHFPMHGFHA